MQPECPSARIEELVAELSPKDDVPATMRKLPERGEKANPNSPGLLVPERVGAPTASPNGRPNQDATERLSQQTHAPTKPASVKPLSPAKYKIQFTASGELRDKLERLQALMRSSVPDGDLASIIEEAVTEKLERLESKRFGKTKKPRRSLEKTNTTPSSRHIPAAVKRAVYARDNGRCTFVDANGRRCTERHRVEFHHRKPFGRGGDHSVGNIELVCKAHNGYLADRDYGKEVTQRYRIKKRSRGGVSEPAAVYTFSNRATSAH